MTRDDFSWRRASLGAGSYAGQNTPGWQEIESEVHRPSYGLLLAVGTLFLVIGGIGFFTIEGAVPPRMPVWIAKSCAAVFASLGGIVVVLVLDSILRPARVRHAAADVLPNVPSEPVIREGLVVHGRVTHELVVDSDGWQLLPSRRLWRDDKRFLFGFGIPFLVLFAGILSWIFHRDGIFKGWPLSVFFGTAATVVSGGSALLLMGMLTRASYRRLCRLSIPHNGGDLELDSPQEPEVERADLNVALKWFFVGETERQRLTIPRELVAAVQLCPWKYKIGKSGGESTTWAVQGLLVLASPEGEAYHRLPLLLTSDFPGAARLMQQLAMTLGVPYLFGADATGWRAEAARAKKRPALRAGGIG